MSEKMELHYTAKWAFFDSLPKGTTFFYKHVEYSKTSKNKAKGIMSGKKIDIPLNGICFPLSKVIFTQKMIVV